MEMIEKIGNVTLDLSKYPGEDLYCDGTVEDEILHIVETTPKDEYYKVIGEKKSWPVFYHLSEQRENIVSWLPFTKEDKVLEVGSGMGAITGALAARCGEVTCVDLSKKRSTINAIRNQEADNVVIHVGNFNDIEPELDRDFDYVLLIGVFEYGASYIPGETPYEDFMRIILRHVKPETGRLVIAIENKMGMKYWAGCQEDHTARLFDGIEDYPNGGPARTFTRMGLEEILQYNHVDEYRFYYPYPDYKFADTIYSDKRLPAPGELTRNLRNFDGDRLLLFDEKNAFDMVIREGLFPLYSNSYVLVTGPDLNYVYTRFSNDRAPEYRIHTRICELEDVRRWVEKLPADERAVDHIMKLNYSYEALRDRYEKGSMAFIVNRLALTEGEDGLPCAQLEYLEGSTLEEILDDHLAAGDMAGFNRLFKEYLTRISSNPASEISDLDLIFGNIIINSEGQWNLIDYEWTDLAPLNAPLTALRALYCYRMGDGKRSAIDLKKYCDMLGLDAADLESLPAGETRFQEGVTGGRPSVAMMRELLGRRALPWQGIFEQMQKNRLEIFEDYGEGYSSQNSYQLYPTYMVAGERKAVIPLKAGLQGLRIDPAECGCMVRMLEASVNGKALDLANRNVLAVNGKELSGEGESQPIFYFGHSDPNLNLRFEAPLEQGAELSVWFELSELSASMTNALDEKMTEKKKKSWWRK